MKNRTFSLFFFALFVWFSAPVFATNYYVATNDPNASDTNNGNSLSTPFKTIQKASALAVAGDIVNIRAGLYRESVKPTNSGTANARIVYQPYNGEEVTISGVDVLTGWTLHQGNIYKTTMEAGFLSKIHNQSDQIFVDGIMMPLARWPNNTSFNPSYPAKSLFSSFVSKLPETDGTTTSKFTDVNLPQNIDLIGAEIYLQPNYEAWSWVFTGKVTATNGTELTLHTVNGSGKDASGGTYDPKSRYFLFNKLSLLDAAGEWYHDLTTNTLYLWCPNNVDPSTVKVEAKKREFAFDLSDKSYITIKDIKIFGSTITTDAEAGGDNKSTKAGVNPYYPWRGRDFLSSSTGVKLDGVTASYITNYTDVSGHFFLQWGLSSGIVMSGTNHEVRNCKIQFSAGNGVTANGKGHKIINNEITDVNYMANDAAAINTCQPGIVYDVEMAYNTIKRTGRSGITPRALMNSTVNNYVARIHHNDVSEYMIQDWDGGGVYNANADCGFLRVDHNTFYNAVNGFLNSGVYFDWSANIIVDHNVIWNNDWPLHFQGYGTGNLNNTLCYNNTTLARNAGNKVYGPFSMENSIGTNQGTVIQNNILVYADGANTNAPSTYTSIVGSGFSSATKITNFLHSAGSPNFVDLANADLQLQSNSPCVDAGTLMTETTYGAWTVPAFNDQLNGKPDIGAYEFGNAKFPTGANLSADNQAPTVPVDLKAENILSDKLLLRWKPATDNVGITAYHVFKNGVFVGYTEQLFFNVKALTTSTQYTFTVKAIDYRGNISDAASLTISTTAVDNTAPSAPTNLRVSDVTLTGFKAIWTPATDNNFVEKYEVKVNGTSKGIVVHPDSTLNIGKLIANTSYQFTVTAIDGNGNSTESTPVTVKTGNAAIITYESFNYSVGTINPDADGTTTGTGYPASNFDIISTGFNGNWGTKSTVLAGSLNYLDTQKKSILTKDNSLAVENGLNSLSPYVYTATGDPFIAYRLSSTLDFGITGTTIWSSVLMNVTDINKDVQLIFRNRSGKNHFRIGIMNQQWCIIDSALTKRGGVNAVANQTTLLLVKTTFGNVGTTSRDDKVELWVNPLMTGELPAPDAVYDNMVGNFSRFRTNTSLLTTDASIWTLDEFRIGLQKDDVLPLGTYTALNQTQQNQTNIYPTITSNKINIVGLEGYRLSMYKLDGQLVHTLDVKSQQTYIDVNNLNKGLYLIKASNATDSKSVKVIVQ